LAVQCVGDDGPGDGYGAGTGTPLATGQALRHRRRRPA